MSARLPSVLLHSYPYQTACCSTRVQRALIHLDGCLVNDHAGIAEVGHILCSIPLGCTVDICIYMYTYGHTCVLNVSLSAANFRRSILSPCDPNGA